MQASQRGNMFIMIFLAIIMAGLLTIAIRGSSGGRQSVSQETLMIESAQAARYGADLQQAVQIILRNGASETDLRFAAPSAAAEYGTISTTPEFQIFSKSGGAALYRVSPASILAGGDGRWEFYGTSDLPGVGSNAADLIAVLPHVTAKFCAAVNKQIGYTGQPDDSVTGTTPDCIEGGATFRYGAGAGFNATPNVLDSASFSKIPANQGCVTCGGDYHYFYVLLAR